MARNIERRLVNPLLRSLIALLLASVLSFSWHGVSYAGDQDGISGYRFKIYDEDGDGIDGNEVGTNGTGGSPMGTDNGSNSEDDASSFSSLTVVWQLRTFLIMWIR